VPQSARHFFGVAIAGTVYAKFCYGRLQAAVTAHVGSGQFQDSPETRPRTPS
jgi:hypothetical protein